jgi:hypothetical protein
MKKRHHVPTPLPRRLSLQRDALVRGFATRTRATVMPADAWLDQLIHTSPAFRSKVEENLVAINVAQAWCRPLVWLPSGS